MNKAKDIQEGNKLIAEFIGMRLESEFTNSGIRYEWLPEQKHSNWTFQAPPPFDTSWDWLMPVVEKIEKDFCNEFEMIIYSCSCVINRWHKKSKKYQSYIHEVGNKKEAIYKAVVQFITWYNTQSK